MKLLLTGTTGHIGTEILTQALANPAITHIYTLTRNPLLPTSFTHKKVTQLLHADFESYPTDLLARLHTEGVSACIWSLGGPAASFPTPDEARKVNIHYAVAAAEALRRSVAGQMRPYEGYPKRRGGDFPFRFVYVSARGAEQDAFRTLWVGGEDRKIKGAAEKALEALAEESEEVGGFRCFETVVLRPGTVLSGGSDDVGTLLTQTFVASISRERLAKAAIKAAMYGNLDGKVIWENADCLGEDWAMLNSFTF